MIKVKAGNWIPFKGFKCITLFGTIYVRKRKDGTIRSLSKETVNHEYIHSLQQSELLHLGFFIWYGIEWLIRFISYSLRWVGRFIRNKKRKYNPYLAYRRISFEGEAYLNEDDLEYTVDRKKFTWLKYI